MDRGSDPVIEISDEDRRAICDILMGVTHNHLDCHTRENIADLRRLSTSLVEICKKTKIIPNDELVTSLVQSWHMSCSFYTERPALRDEDAWCNYGEFERIKKVFEKYTLIPQKEE
jgi:hypothetical protein